MILMVKYIHIMKLVNKAERGDTVISRMEKRSMLSNVVNYVQYNIHLRTSII